MRKNDHVMNNTLRLRSLAIASLTIALAFTSPSIHAAQTLNFNDAMQMMLTANPRMTDSEARIDAAAAGVTESIGNGMPSLDVQMNAARSNNPLNVFSYKLSQGVASFDDFGAGEYTGTNSLDVRPRNLNTPGYYSNYNTGIVLNFPIYTGGDTTARTKRAKALLTAAKHGSEAAKNQLAFELLQSYEGWHAAKAIARESQRELDIANAYLKRTKQLYQQSIVIESDVMLMQSFQRTANIRLKMANAEAMNQLDTFRTLIGKKHSNYVPGRSIMLHPIKASLDTNISQALQHNPQLQALRSESNAHKEEIRSAKSSNWPQLNLQLRHDWNSDNLSLRQPSNTAMLALNWRLFSSGAQTSAGKRAEAAFESAIAAFDNASNDIRLQILKTRRDTEIASAQLQTVRRNATELKDAVNILYSRYGQGLIPIGQLLDARSRLDQSRIQTITSRYQLLLARAQLLALTNQLITGGKQHAMLMQTTTAKHRKA